MANATPAAPIAPPTNNPNWWRTGFAIVAFSILLRVGLHVPLLTTFTALGIIYLTHVLAFEFGAASKMVWTGVKGAVVMLVGIAIFLALRFLIAGVVGVYPIDTYNDPSGLLGMFPTRDISKVLLWEIVFAFVAGKMTINWARGRDRKVETIFVLSLIILSVQFALPIYANSWPTRDTVGTTLVDRGVVGTAWRGGWAFLFGRPIPPPPPAPVVPQPIAVVEFPTSGEGHVTKTVGIKAYLDPARTFTRPTGPAKYVFVEDPLLFFDDVMGHVVDRTPNRKKWQEMPAGRYMVYPLDRESIFFKWWQ